MWSLSAQGSAHSLHIVILYSDLYQMQVIVTVNVLMVTNQSGSFPNMYPSFWSSTGARLDKKIVLTTTAETAPPWIRGALVCTYQLFITLGIFLAACFNYGTYTHQRGNSGSWRIVLGTGWVWTLILGIGILLFLETPRYAYRKGRTQEAKKLFAKFTALLPTIAVSTFNSKR